MSDSKKLDEKPIKFTDREMEQMKKLTCQDPSLAKFATSIGSGKIAPLEESSIRSHSFKAMSEQVKSQMNQILEQMKLLAKQVEKLQNRQKVSEVIYLSKMSFEPIVGSTYYLYFSKKENRNILSMIGPSEWGKSKNELKFIAEVTLLADRTWEVVKMDESFTFDNF